MLDPVGARVARTGVTANQISFAGFALGLGAAVAVAFGAGTAAVLLIIANRLLDGLDGAVARSTGSTDLGAYLDITLDFLFYSAVPFAFAVADPANATAAAFLIFSFVGTGSSFRLLPSSQKCGILTEIRGKRGSSSRRLDRQRDHHFSLGRGLLPDLFVPLARVAPARSPPSHGGLSTDFQTSAGVGMKFGVGQPVLD